LVLASSTGGIGQHVASLAEGLAAAGVAVTVCGPAATEERFGFTRRGAASLKADSSYPPAFPEAVFIPVEIPASPRPGDARAVTQLRRALDSAQVDVVHAHGLRAGFVAALAGGRRDGRPLVVTWHNAVLAGGLRGRASRLLERIVARAATVTLGASEDLVRRAAALGAADARLGAVAAPALPPPKRPRGAVRAELGAGGDVPLILSVGRLHPQKGYDVLVTVASRWRNRRPPPVVAIAGSGPSYLALAARISADRAPVTLLGHRSDVADLLAAADVAVVTSVWEARQLFAQEALRAGVPLVATAVGGLPGLVGDAALLVPAGDVDAVDAAVGKLLDDPGLRAEYGRRGVAQAATWTTEEQTLAQVRAIYAEVTQADPHGGDPAGAFRPRSGDDSRPPDQSRTLDQESDQPAREVTG
jgi:glycosyltransferase involved in cell wall biosynthesis